MVLWGFCPSHCFPKNYFIFPFPKEKSKDFLFWGQGWGITTSPERSFPFCCPTAHGQAKSWDGLILEWEFPSPGGDSWAALQGGGMGRREGWGVQTSGAQWVWLSPQAALGLIQCSPKTWIFWFPLSLLLEDSRLLLPGIFSLCSPKKSLDSLPFPKGANWQADVLQKGYCSQNTAVLFWIKSCGALFILEYFYFLCTTYNHVLLTEIYFKEKKKKNLEVFFKKKVHKNLY